MLNECFRLAAFPISQVNNEKYFCNKKERHLKLETAIKGANIDEIHQAHIPHRNPQHSKRSMNEREQKRIAEGTDNARHRQCCE